MDAGWLESALKIGYGGRNRGYEGIRKCAETGYTMRGYGVHDDIRPCTEGRRAFVAPLLSLGDENGKRL